LKCLGVLILTLHHLVCVLYVALPGEDAEEDEAEENPIAIEFQDVQDAFYMKDPRKALQGFFDREGASYL